MALTATIDLTVTPIKLTVTSDRRKAADGTVTVAGESATFSAYFEPKITDSTGRVWTKKTDDGATATYTG